MMHSEHLEHGHTHDPHPRAQRVGDGRKAASRQPEPSLASLKKVFCFLSKRPTLGRGRETTVS